MSRHSAIVIVATALLSLSATVLAQPRWGTGELPRAGACFYEDVNMRGQYFCVRPGENLASLPEGMSDRISAIRIFGDADVVVFRDARFRGPSARFITDARDLRREGWNDRISSIRVALRRGGGWSGERGPVWGNEAPPREGACFYQDANFRGPYFCVPQGASYVRLPPGFNDRISSVRLFRATAIIFSDVEFGGRSARLTSNTPYLGRGPGTIACRRSAFTKMAGLKPRTPATVRSNDGGVRGFSLASRECEALASRLGSARL